MDIDFFYAYIIDKSKTVSVFSRTTSILISPLLHDVKVLPGLDVHPQPFGTGQNVDGKVDLSYHRAAASGEFARVGVVDAFRMATPLEGLELQAVRHMDLGAVESVFACF